jgi:hypothetical protein
MRETLPPDVSVAQSASMPGRPVRPAYLRDAAIALGASLLVALGAVMFDVQLTRPVVPASLPETRTVFYPLPASHPLLGTHLDEFARVPPMQALPPGRQRELSPDDVIALLRVSDLPTRALVTALLSGLAIDEAVALRWRDIDAEASLIRVPGDEARTITLPRDAARFFLDNAPADYDPGALVWGDGGGGTQRASYIDALVASAARAADVDRPAEITCGTLRFTYLAFLARQGVPLDQLPRFVGRVSAEMQSHLQLLSPPGRRETTPGVFLGEWAFDGALGANRGDPTS